MVLYIGIVCLVLALMLCIGLYQRVRRANLLIESAERQAALIRKEVEAERRDGLIKLKDEIHRRKIEFETELQRERNEQERISRRLASRAEEVDKREQQSEALYQELQQKERVASRLSDQLHQQEKRVKLMNDELVAKLEQISGMNREEAKAVLVKSLEAEVKLGHEKWLQREEEAAQRTAKERAIQIVVNAMQRYAPDQVAHHSSGVVHLPNDEMKGRIIGKEGRNIKSLEMATGMEFVIGDVPEIITISGFNPIRREVARRSLEKLISGRTD